MVEAGSTAAPDVGRVLKVIRVVTNQTQVDLARKAGLEPTELSRFESGTRRISARAAAKLGRALFESADEAE